MTENEVLKDLQNYQGILRAKARINASVNPEIALNAITEAIEIIQQYRAIGTVEEIEKTLQNMSVLLASYTANGSAEEFKALKEKSVAKKVDVWANGEEHCPCCDKNLTTFWGFANCFDCGQKLDWSE